MRIVCLILGLMIAAPTFAGTLYIGNAPTTKTRQLFKAMEAVAEFDDAGVDESDEAVTALIDPAKVKQARKARANLDAIQAVVGYPDAVALAGAMEAGNGIVAVTVEADSACGNFQLARQRAATACAIVGAKIKSVSVGKMRRFKCKPKAGESLWGVEICE